MLDTKVSRLEEGPRRDTLLHSLTSAYSDVSKEAFEASAISPPNGMDRVKVLSERQKVNWHAVHKPLYVPQEHVYVYLSVLGGMVVFYVT